ncbi:MAG: DJ-1 family glyoxalase III [Planctomycetota bacterium]
MARVLVALAPGAEEIETMGVADTLVRAGCTVTIAAAAPTLTLRGSRDLPLAADTLLADLASETFDCLFCPGGMGSAEHCQADPLIQDLLERQLAGPGLLALICACPIALLPRALCTGRRLTCYPALRDRFADQAQWIDAPVVVDGNLITSQGPGTTIHLGLELARQLVDEATADSVAAAMLVEPLSARSAP